MKRRLTLWRLLVSRSRSLKIVAVGALLALAGCAATDSGPVRFAGTECVRPPVMHCPDKDCPTDVMINQGPVIEPKTQRTYFLDYPCDMQRGEKVNVILSLHGGGSYGNWQRNYFPLMDYVDKYRLVVATPNTRAWSPNDDPYLHNIVTSIIDEIGPENVKSFWLVGHSMGSFNSRRLVCTDFFRDKADGYLSLSGGRVGSPPEQGVSQFNIPRQNDDIASARPAGPPPGARPPGGAAGGRPAGPPGGGLFSMANQIKLDCDFSFIFAGGGNEPSSINLPATSSWAEKYHCGKREIVDEIVDTKGGYVYDSSRQQYGNDAWGRLPRGGKAQVKEYPRCDDGRIVADVTRLDKGHTEGLEPHITEKLLQMMLSAKSGKIREAN